ncbi:MAG: PQQ-binding-like beta-propeller repeat protein, partial [Verrucomicrobiota bacterium]
MSSRTLSLFPILFLVASISPLAEAEWPEFRGPTFDGHAPATVQVPLQWSERENIRWKVEVAGKAWSTPIVMDGRVYITTAAPKRNDLSLQGRCYDLATGELIWEQEAFEVDDDR